MVKCVAQMRNVRRGHDAQGRLKSIQLDDSEEGYANFMAAGRVDSIAAQVQNLSGKDAAKVYTEDVLRPATETYLTAAWDEMVPFPTTWKLRFDGFGASDYSDKDGNRFGKLSQPKLPDDAPPWYQPPGWSEDGGVFGESLCTCRNRSSGSDAMKGPTLTTGCGLPHHTQGYNTTAYANGKP